MTDAPTGTTAAGTVAAPASGTVTQTASGLVHMEKVVEHNEPSSLPELDWFWRRLYVFALTTFCCALVWVRSDGLGDLSLRTVLKAAIWTINFLVLAYIVGASAEKVVQIVAALKSTRRERTVETPAPRPDLEIPPMPEPTTRPDPDK